MTTTHKVVNFGAGPAKLPPEVLEQAQKELIHYDLSGISVLEMSHRSKQFTQIMDAAESLLREILNIPSHYKVIFLQGGGLGQFAAVPMNLIGLKNSHSADYIITGSWSLTAFKEAQKYGNVNRVLPTNGPKFTSIPDQSTWQLNPDASYVYYCDNETIDGVEFPFVPETNGVPLVCDMSSNFMSRPVDISKFGLVFAGAQKNIGCAGVTVVIVRDDLLGNISPQTPSVWDYKKLASMKSCVNTPPTFSVYILGLVLDWMKRLGGIEALDEQNRTKANLLYRLIDSSGGFYYVIHEQVLLCAASNPVDVTCRSNMNVPFRIAGPNGNEEFEKRFVAEAAKQGMIQLNGHRSVGGLRASLYNAITVDDVKQLVKFMIDFQLRHTN